MKLRVDKDPWLVLEGDVELLLTIDALKFTREAGSDCHDDLIRRAEAVVWRIAGAQQLSGDDNPHHFAYLEADSEHILASLEQVADCHQDSLQAFLARQMLNDFRQSSEEISQRAINDSDWQQ